MKTLVKRWVAVAIAAFLMITTVFSLTSCGNSAKGVAEKYWQAFQNEDISGILSTFQDLVRFSSIYYNESYTVAHTKVIDDMNESFENRDLDNYIIGDYRELSESKTEDLREYMLEEFDISIQQAGYFPVEVDITVYNGGGIDYSSSGRSDLRTAVYQSDGKWWMAPTILYSYYF